MSDFDDDLKKIDEALDQYEKEHIGLPERQQYNAPEVLYMNIADLRKKTPEYLAESSLELARYTLEVERKINKEKAWERWAKLKSDEYTAKFLEDVPQGYGWNERILIARNKPDVCKRLNGFIREIEMKLSRLYNVPKHIEVISKCIDNLRFIALKREKSE